MWFSKINGYRGERIMKKRSKRYKEIIKLSTKGKKVDINQGL